MSVEVGSVFHPNLPPAAAAYHTAHASSNTVLSKKTNGMDA
jgi:hypothetical protein